ncbi:hypothetical protein EYY60_18755 [Flavobacterium zhairuonense]|uniref:hypothetical protein n=1 Tax=Flavobacterium zhairuonense TaxID=2493631 RepID=UPI00104E250A|nr:hypothetical protein [Flavobacterium zhairuonense]KAF2507986.1 hypothetical protein EYY60_18755 [Flavobacterium zhairuonense]
MGLILIIWPFVILAIIGLLIDSKKSISKTTKFVSFLIISVVIFLVARRINKKTEVDKNDVYGEYVIDTTHFYGKQAKWQYNHFRFEIKRNNKVVFQLTEQNKIVKSYAGSVEFLEGYIRPRIIFHFKDPVHHIVKENPTLYRDMWSFYYVFNSSKFGNVFFKKGKWEPIVESN